MSDLKVRFAKIIMISAFAASWAYAEEDRPNIIFIFSDDHAQAAKFVGMRKIGKNGNQGHLLEVAHVPHEQVIFAGERQGFLAYGSVLLGSAVEVETD